MHKLFIPLVILFMFNNYLIYPQETNYQKKLEILDKYSKHFNYDEKKLYFAHKNNDYKTIINCNIQIGLIYYHLGMLEKSVNLFKKAIKVAIKNNMTATVSKITIYIYIILDKEYF